MLLDSHENESQAIASTSEILVASPSLSANNRARVLFGTLSSACTKYGRKDRKGWMYISNGPCEAYVTSRGQT